LPLLDGRWLNLAEALLEICPAEALGVLGSALVGLDQRPDGVRIKDVDFSVHGRENHDRVKEQIGELRARSGATAISPSHVMRHSRKFGAPFAPWLNTWTKTLNRKWSSLQLAEGLLATVRFAYAAGEEPEDALAFPLLAQDVVVSGVVSEDQDVDFMPRRFRLETGAGEREAVSYFWGHQSCVRRGDHVSVSGDLREGGLVTISSLRHGVRIED
jgi:predicted nucleotidyltransferase